MAAPPTASILDISGRWLLNRALSDSTEAFFALQGIPWIVRKVVNFASLELQYERLPPASGSTAPRFGYKQTIRPGGFDTKNEYILDGQARVDTVPIFGEISMRCHYAGGEEVAKQYQTTGLESADEGHAAVVEIVESEVMGWTATSVWGFEVVGGERRFVKHNTAVKGEKAEKTRLVFDYLGPPQP
ncbi:hypothetical protein VTI74DRAFT_3468 [Chaetomium olivicolor]